MKNKRPGPCMVCGVMVGELQGTLVGPPWKVKCALHSGMLDPIRIVVAKEGNRAVFSIQGFLGDRFAAYRKALTGALYNGDRKVNTAPFDKALGMINALKTEGFVVDIESPLAASLQAFTACMKSEAAEASTRTDVIDAQLRERGLFLFPFQRTGVAWLISRMTGLLADDMGLGKTIQILIAIPAGAPVLVVCPAVAKGVWKREVQKWRPEIKVTSLSGRGNFRWPEPGEMVIVNYDILPSATTKRGERELIPFGTHDATARVTERFPVLPGDDIALSIGKGDAKLMVSVNVFSKGGVDGTIRVIDETSPEASRTVKIPETFTIEGKAYKPTEMSLMYSTTGPVEFGVSGTPHKIGDPAPGTVLVADEAHSVKNSKAQRTNKFRELSQKVLDVPNGRAWLATATPLMNRPQELWSVLQSAALGREAFGGWKGFTEAMGGSEGDYGWEWGTPDPAKCAEALRRVSLRRERLDVLPELPVKTYETIIVEIDTKTKKLLDKLDNTIGKRVPIASWERLLRPKPLAGIPLTPEVQAELDEAKKVVSDALDHLGKKGGLSFEEFSQGRAALATAKIPALLELMDQFEEQEEPVVVFSAHLSPLHALAKREGWGLITGETPPEKRTALEDAFQAGKLKGLACSIKAGGVAITLTHSHYAVFVDKEPTPTLNEQGEDRVCRIGQDRGVIIISLVADHPLDQRIDELNSSKRVMIKASVSASSVGEDTEPEQLAEVDFQKLAEEAAAESKKVDDANQAVMLRIQEYEGARNKAHEQILAGNGGFIADFLDDAEKQGLAVERRPPANPKEVWAARALLVLAALDPDRARELNDSGFNSADGSLGHAMAGQVVYGLTDKQWPLAMALCTKYWRQVGRPPVLAGSTPTA